MDFMSHNLGERQGHFNAFWGARTRERPPRPGRARYRTLVAAPRQTTGDSTRGNSGALTRRRYSRMPAQMPGVKADSSRRGGEYGFLATMQCRNTVKFSPEPVRAETPAFLSACRAGWQTGGAAPHRFGGPTTAQT